MLHNQTPIFESNIQQDSWHDTIGVCAQKHLLSLTVEARSTVNTLQWGLCDPSKKRERKREEDLTSRVAFASQLI